MDQKYNNVTLINMVPIRTVRLANCTLRFALRLITKKQGQSKTDAKRIAPIMTVRVHTGPSGNGSGKPLRSDKHKAIVTVVPPSSTPNSHINCAHRVGKESVSRRCQLRADGREGFLRFMTASSLSPTSNLDSLVAIIADLSGSRKEIAHAGSTAESELSLFGVFFVIRDRKYDYPAKGQIPTIIPCQTNNH